MGLREHLRSMSFFTFKVIYLCLDALSLSQFIYIHQAMCQFWFSLLLFSGILCILSISIISGEFPSSTYINIFLVHSLGVLSCFSRVWVFATPWTVARQAPLSMGFSRQEYWGGLLCPPPGDLSNPGIEPASPVAPALQADSLPQSHRGNKMD